MAIEKNIIFIYPINSNLIDLKNELEKDESYIIYEVDSVGEYKQIIGILEHSVTFSFDMKKTSKYLQDNSSYLLGDAHKNFALSSKTIPPFVIGKLKNYGLNEILKDDVKPKHLLHKIESFFTGLEAKEKSERELKEKSISGLMIMNKGPAPKNNDSEKQRVEKLLSVDDAKDTVPTFKRFDLSSFKESGGFNSNKINSSHKFGSPFDNLQRRKVNAFVDQTAGNKLKRGLFKEVEIDKKRKTFEEVVSDFNKKNGHLDLPDLDNNLKRKKFTEIDADLNKKNGRLDLPDLDNNLKRKHFDEVDRNLNKKDGRLNLIGPNKERDSKEVSNKNLDLNRKNGNLNLLEQDIELKRKKLLDQDKEDKNKKPKLNLSDLDHELKRKEFTEIEREKENKKLNLDELDFESVSKENEKNEPDVKKKSKHMDFPKIDPSKKNGHFDEIKRDSTFNELESLKKDKEEKKSEISIDLNKKIKTKEENLSLDKLRNQEENILERNKKDWGEQTIDYRSLKVTRNTGRLKLESNTTSSGSEVDLEQAVMLPEKKYFYPGTYGLDFLIHANAMSLNITVDNLKILKFIHFSIMKEMNGIVSFYTINNKSGDENSNKYSLVYDGHTNANLEKYSISASENYLESFYPQWEQVELPTWQDETYTSSTNEFVYPYFENGKKFGFAVAHFLDSVTGHYLAVKAELLLMSAKSIILSESE